MPPGQSTDQPIDRHTAASTTASITGSRTCPVRCSSTTRRTASSPVRSGCLAAVPSSSRPRAAGRTTSVALEKTQVAALAERIDELLDEVVRRTGGNAPGAGRRARRGRRHRAAGRPRGGGVPGRHHGAGLGRRGTAHDRRGPGAGGAGRRLRGGPRGGRGAAAAGRGERPADAARPAQPAPRPGPSPSARWTWSTPAGRRARCAACRSTRKDTYVRARTDTAAERDRDRACELLAKGELTVRGRIREASNAVLYCYRRATRAAAPPASTSRSPGSGRCGTSPTGSWRSARWPRTRSPRRLGWDLVPPTVLRDGPYGEGMCQLWIEARTPTGVRSCSPSSRARSRARAGRPSASPRWARAGPRCWCTPTTSGCGGWPCSTR